MAGKKNDDGKPSLASIAVYLPLQPLLEIAAVFAFGHEKYGFDNWRKGFNWLRIFSACLRHLWAWVRGEDKDQETGLSHLAHAAANILFLLEFQEKGLGEDDRKSNSTLFFK